MSELITRLAQTFIVKSSRLVQCSGTDFIGPIAGLNELESPEQSPSESVLGPVESILKVQAGLFRSGTDLNGSVVNLKWTDVRP